MLLLLVFDNNVGQQSNKGVVSLPEGRLRDVQGGFRKALDAALQPCTCGAGRERDKQEVVGGWAADSPHQYDVSALCEGTVTALSRLVRLQAAPALMLAAELCSKSAEFRRAELKISKSFFFSAKVAHRFHHMHRRELPLTTSFSNVP